VGSQKKLGQQMTVLSVDYRNARDEFTRHDLFEKIKPALNKRLAESKQTEKIYLNVGGRLGDYDFTKKAFPLGVEEATYIPYKNGYAITFTNSKDVSYLPVPFEKARELSGSLRKDRRTTMIFHCSIVGAKEQKVSWNAIKNLRVKINKLDVSLRSGEPVGDIIP
jgi:hypothetical protein